MEILGTWVPFLTSTSVSLISWIMFQQGTCSAAKEQRKQEAIDGRKALAVFKISGNYHGDFYPISHILVIRF